MMKRNLFTVLMITLFLITLMTSCKTKKEEPADETGTEEITDETRETETTQSGITDEEVVLKISVFSTSNHLLGGLDEVTESFEELYENIDIKIVPFITESKLQNVALEDIYLDYYKKIIDDFENGGGEDIYFAPDIASLKINKENYFLDLKKFIDKEENFNNENYYFDILKPFEDDGKLYTLPMGFGFDIIFANKIIADSAKNSFDTDIIAIDDLYKFSEENKNENSTLNQPYLEYLKNQTIKNLDEFLDIENDTSDFNNEKFAVIKENADRLQEAGLFKDEVIENLEQFREAKIASNFDLSSVRFFVYEAVLANEDSAIINEEDINNMKESLNHDKFTTIGVPSYSDKFDVKLDGGFSINKNSENSDVAWNFLIYLQNPKLQENSIFGDVPFSKVAHKNILKDFFISYVDSSKNVSDADKDTFGEKCSDYYFDAFDGYRDLLTADGNMITKEFIIEFIISDEFSKFEFEMQTLDETMNNITNRVNNYLQA